MSSWRTNLRAPLPSCLSAHGREILWGSKFAEMSFLSLCSSRWSSRVNVYLGYIGHLWMESYSPTWTYKTESKIDEIDLKTTLLSQEIFSRCRQIRTSILNFLKISFELKFVYLITIKFPFAEARLAIFSETLRLFFKRPFLNPADSLMFYALGELSSWKAFPETTADKFRREKKGISLFSVLLISLKYFLSKLTWSPTDMYLPLPVPTPLSHSPAHILYPWGWV